MAGVGSYYEILGRLGTGNSHSRETRKSQASKEVTGDDGPVLGVLPRAALAATLLGERRKVTSNTGARRGTAGPKMEPGGDSLLGGMAGRKVRIGAVFQAARSVALEQGLRIGAGSEAMDLAVARADDGERASTVKVAGEVTEKKHAGKVSSTYPPDL